MARRLKTKKSPTSFRLDDDALKALTILESQQADKDRSEIVGENLIAAAENTDPPAPIAFAELSPKEIFALRADNAENRKTAEIVKAALRAAKPGTKEEGKKLADALSLANQVLESCNQLDKSLRSQAANAASVKAEEVAGLKWAYNKAATNHRWAVEKFGSDPKAPERAEGWAKMANLCRIFRPEVGPEIMTPTAFPTVLPSPARTKTKQTSEDSRHG